MNRTLGRFMIIFALAAASVTIAAAGPDKAHDGLAPQEMRGELSRMIVEDWANAGARRVGVTPKEWAVLMAPIFERADIGNLEKAASATTLGQMESSLLGGVVPQSIGDIDADLVFTPIVSCRIVDTRLVGGPIARNTSRSFDAYTATDFTAQGGSSGDCGLPENVSALLVRVTALNPPSFGFLTAYPSNEARPLASSLNYFAGAITSNSALFRLCRPGCASEFNVFTNTQTGVVVDVEGYFVEPVATALDCTVAQQTGNLDLLGGLQQRSVSCPAGYTATGGGCGGPLGIGVSNTEPLLTAGQPTGWSCDLVGSLLSVISYEVNAVCCRVPGR